MLDKLGLHSVDFFFQVFGPILGAAISGPFIEPQTSIVGPVLGIWSVRRCSEVYFVLNPLFTKTCRMKSIRGLPINYWSLFRPGKTVAGRDVEGWGEEAKWRVALENPVSDIIGSSLFSSLRDYDNTIWSWTPDILPDANTTMLDCVCVTWVMTKLYTHYGV